MTRIYRHIIQLKKETIELKDKGVEELPISIQ